MPSIRPPPPWVTAEGVTFEADTTSVAPPVVTREGHDPVTGRFLPGHSGNPKGRPPAHRAALLEGMESVIAVLKKAALAGDVQAAALIFSRTIPPLRPETNAEAFALDTSASVVEQCRQVLQAAADGRISFERAKEYVELIGSIKDIADVEAALDELHKIKRGKVTENDGIPAGHVFHVDAAQLMEPKPQ